MKPSSFLNYLLLLALFTPVYSVYAQVTIGSDSSPTLGAMLQLKQKITSGVELTNASKGFLYPRVSLVDPYSLVPLVSATEDQIEENQTQATGMMVFNTAVIPEKRLDLGVYLWNGTQWVLVIDALGSASFDPINASDIIVNGAYHKGDALGSQNTLTITFMVNSPGKYEVSTTTVNGYYFAGSGSFSTTGKHIVTIPGFGIPLKSTQIDLANIPDNIVVQINAEPSVTKTNIVLGIPASFNINCAAITVFGSYKPNTLLTASEYVTIRVSSNASAAGAVYKISTDNVNGYNFAAEGVLLGTNNQTVYLYPTTYCG